MNKNSNEQPTGKKLNRLKWFVNTFVILTAIFYLTGTFIKDYSKISTLEVDINPYFLCISISLFVLMNFFQALNGVLILRAHGYTGGILRGIRDIMFSLLGKYIPGKVWVIIFRTKNLTGLGISGTGIVAATVLEHIHLFTIALLYGSSAALWILGDPLFWVPVILSFLALGYLVIWPSSVLSLHNRIARRLGRPLIVGVISSSESLTIMLRTLVTWFLFSIATWAGTLAFAHLSLKKTAAVCASHAVAVVSGFLAFFSPGGLGVRESVFVFIDPVSSGVLVVILTVGFRLFISISEILTMMLAHAAYAIVCQNQVKN